MGANFNSREMAGGDAGQASRLSFIISMKNKNRDRQDACPAKIKSLQNAVCDCLNFPFSIVFALTHF
jgi:hypothetical protein